MDAATVDVLVEIKLGERPGKMWILAGEGVAFQRGYKACIFESVVFVVHFWQTKKPFTTIVEHAVTLSQKGKDKTISGYLWPVLQTATAYTGPLLDAVISATRDLAKLLRKKPQDKSLEDSLKQCVSILPDVMHENDFSIPSNLSSALSFKGPTGVCTPAMEPDFLLLLTDLPGPAADWVRSLGAETCSDIRHLWPSAATLVGEWLEGPGAGCSAEAGVQLAHFYNAAARSSELACKRLAQNVVADRQSRFCSEASKRSLVLPAAQPKSKARMLFLNREGHTDVPALTYAPATSKPAVAEGEVRGLKLRALFILCCQLFLRPEDLGVATLDFCDTEAIDSLAGCGLMYTLPAYATVPPHPGVRPAYSWAMPPVSFGTLDVVSELRRFLQDEFSLLGSVQRFLLQCGVPPEEAARAQYNRLRRFLPTGGQVLGMSPQDAQALGSWMEIPFEDKRQSGRQDLMSTHYSGQRVLASMYAKRKVVQSVLAHPCARDAHTSPLASGSFLWAHLGQASEPLELQPGAHPPDGVPASSEEDEASDETSPSSSTSSSDTSSGDARELFPLDEIEWFKQKSCTHFVRERDESNRLDKGLLSCLQAANVQDPWIQAFQDVHRIESLEDFVFLVTHARWEDSLRELVNEVPSLKDNRLALARWKAAYTMGHSAIQQGNAPDKEALDIDNPIPEGQHSQLAAEWTRVYNLPLDPHLDPSDSLRGRIWREFRRRSLTLLELKRVKSIIGGSSPLEEERISLDAGVTLAFGKDTATAPKNVTDAYLRLRTLMNAWAFSGNFKMKCLDGQDKIAMPLHVAMNYADMCLRHTSSYGGNSLQWLLKNDLLTRGAMCAKVRRGICPAVALEESLRETHLEWRSPGVRADGPVPEAPPPSLDAEADAEALAADLLSRADWSMDACVSVLRAALSKPVANRRRAVLGSEGFVAYFILGAFSRPGACGVTTTSLRMPRLCQYLNRWLLRLFPGGSWASIAVSHNQAAEVHADEANDPQSLNHSVSVGTFTGGELWIEDSQSGTIERVNPLTGQSVFGRLVPTCEQGFSFPPTALHATAPWVGDRWAITAFTPRQLDCLPKAQIRELREWGFPWILGSPEPLTSLPPVPPAAKRARNARTVALATFGGSQAMSSSCMSVAVPSDSRRVELASRLESDHVGSRQGSLADRLLSARPVSWRGLGDLAQLPGVSAPQGHWLVLDLWAGVSGLCIALLALGLHFYAVAAECDPEAVACASEVMPSIVHVADVRDISVQSLLPMIGRRKLRGIIVGGGSPCQPNSSLNQKRRGLKDSRGCEPLVLRELVSALETSPDCRHLEVVSFLENVASAPLSVQNQYTEWMQCQPLRSDASSCGWTTRNRLYWLRDRTKQAVDSQAPLDWQIEQPPGQTASLVYKGKKPLPARVHFEDGFCWLQDPCAVMKGDSPAGHTLTREFWHQDDLVARVSPQAAARFHMDSCRFPPGSYEEHSLVWRRDEWRQLSPSERAQMLGIPDSATSAVQGVANKRVQTRNSLLGNGFHIFTLIALFALVPQLCDARVDVSPLPTEHLHGRLRHTVWEPGQLEAFPGLLNAAAIIRHMRSQLSEYFVPSCVWQDCERRLTACDLPLLQAFPAWQRSRGCDWERLPPALLTAKVRSKLYAGNTGQRFSSSQSKGLDHVLPPGLGKQDHMALSASLPSPFKPSPWPDDDVQFVAHTIAVWREHTPALASRQRHVLQTACRAIRPLHDALRQLLGYAARKVASEKSAAVVAFFTAILRWPDFGQASCFIKGFPIVGEVSFSGVFRPLDPGEDCESVEDWLCRDGRSAVQAILHSPPPRFAKEILAQTLQERDKGFCSDLMSKSEVDALFGEGAWRPMERFLLQQSEGKLRLVDNCRKTDHNSHAQLQETIFTVSVDFIATCVRDVFQVVASVPDPSSDPAAFLQVRLGTDDLPDAYRGHPVQDSHLRFSVVSVFVPGTGWRFTVLYGLAFGLEAAVVAFNRLPLLGVAVARRCTTSLCAAYFDDELSLEFISGHDVSQQGLTCVFRLLGSPPQPSKAFPPAPNRHYLGTSVHVADSLEGFVSFQPKFLTRCKVLASIDDALQMGRLDRDKAGKLRGDLQWFFSMISGFAGRLANPVLRKFQKSDVSSLDDDSRSVLETLRDIVELSVPRSVQVSGVPLPVTRVYTDASFEAGILRLGWVVMSARLQRPWAGTCTVPEAAIQEWCQRAQQIYMGESLAGVLVPLLREDVFRNSDVLWFVDNEAAVSSLIKASSREDDVHDISLAAALVRSALCCRVWFEWVDSNSNPSDGLSRLGVLDPWSLDQGWDISEMEFPSRAYRSRLRESLLRNSGCDENFVLQSRKQYAECAAIALEMRDWDKAGSAREAKEPKKISWLALLQGLWELTPHGGLIPKLTELDETLKDKKRSGLFQKEVLTEFAKIKSGSKQARDRVKAGTDVMKPDSCFGPLAEVVAECGNGLDTAPATDFLVPLEAEEEHEVLALARDFQLFPESSLADPWESKFAYVAGQLICKLMLVGAELQLVNMWAIWRGFGACRKRLRAMRNDKMATARLRFVRTHAEKLRKEWLLAEQPLGLLAATLV
ncbi:hypothetical protein AK812_SmicGene17832 [Symbiodinium microadriaticum]|uniref:Uncharacterized protein n=1 Tax=Symbiodinium microadriaticum TaxID=2951 RepID=A0A1Q9DWS4_SYMMI|nr:hypothetical protein AK812_SmicGene17832 [Symbiodinium microadriaticum]